MSDFRAAPGPDKIEDFETLEEFYGPQQDEIEPAQLLSMTNASMLEAARIITYAQQAMAEGNEDLAEFLMLTGTKLAYQSNVTFLLLQAYVEQLDEVPDSSEQAPDGVRTTEPGPSSADSKIIGSIHPGPEGGEKGD